MKMNKLSDTNHFLQYRYFHLVEHTIEDSAIAAIEEAWVVGVYRFVSRKLCLKFPDKLKGFTYEMNRHYLSSMKRSIVDYVLMDPEEQQRLGVQMLPEVRYRPRVFAFNFGSFEA